MWPKVFLKFLVVLKSAPVTQRNLRPSGDYCWVLRPSQVVTEAKVFPDAHNFEVLLQVLTVA